MAQVVLLLNILLLLVEPGEAGQLEEAEVEVAIELPQDRLFQFKGIRSLLAAVVLMERSMAVAVTVVIVLLVPWSLQPAAAEAVVKTNPLNQAVQVAVLPETPQEHQVYQDKVMLAQVAPVVVGVVAEAEALALQAVH